MSSERGKFVAIFGAIVVAFAAGIFYFVKIHSPKKAKASAREELAVWDKKWNELRKCLVGDSPGSSNIGEAIALYVMSEGIAEPNCLGLAGKLARPEGEASGIDAIETGWEELERAANKIGDALIKRKKTRGVSDPLPAAFEAAIAARNSLADAMDGDPLPAQLGAAALPAAKLIPFKAERISTEAFPPSAAGAVYSSRGKGAEIVLVPGADPQLSADLDLTMAVPDRTWGAESDDEGIATMSVSSKGDRGDTTVIKVKEINLLPAVIGTKDQGIVVGGGTTNFVVARGKLGAFTADAPVKTPTWIVRYDASGRAVVVWHDEKEKKSRAALLQPGQPDRPLELGETNVASISRMCFTRDRVWMQGSGELIGLGIGANPVPTVRRNVPHFISGCSGDTMMAHTPTELELCSSSCRTVSIKARRGPPLLTSYTVVDGKLVSISVEGVVARVLREGGKPVYYALPEVVDLAYGLSRPPMATSDGKVIDVLGHTTKGYVILRIPVPA